MVLGMSGDQTPMDLLTSPFALGSIAQCIGYALQAPAPPFPVIVLAYAINGFGIALQVGDIYSTLKEHAFDDHYIGCWS